MAPLSWADNTPAGAASKMFVLRRALDVAVGAAGEAPLFALVHGVGARPRPAAEPGALEVDDRLPDLLARAHHEGSVVDDRLADRLALQQQRLGLLRAAGQLGVQFGAQLDAVVPRDGVAVDVQAGAAEEVQRPVRAGRRR